MWTVVDNILTLLKEGDAAFPYIDFNFQEENVDSDAAWKLQLSFIAASWLQRFLQMYGDLRVVID